METSKSPIYNSSNVIEEAGLIYDESDTFRDSIATVDKNGKRIWLYPKKPKGKFTNYRNYLSAFLLAILFITPFIKLGGEPLVMLNIIERKFIILGVVFYPQDFHLFLFLMLTGFVFIILFTVVFGRIFCGWVCPQTIFMESVFRKIEYWIEGDSPAQKRLDSAPWTTDKIIKKLSKHAIFFAISVIISNIFLSYIISMDKVIQIISEPISEHKAGFISMLLFSGAFYFVFSRLREQVCTTICPYGRLQGVLLDKNSIVISYDWLRGEPRGKIKKRSEPTSVGIQLGDCIDCKLCVHVCPTGIDIRNGTQLECINCTACIDACDEVMKKVNRPTGLIRYDSYSGIETGKRTLFTPRAIVYSVILGLLIITNIFLLTNRSPVEALVLRTPGKLFQRTEDGKITNLYNYQLTNKSGKEMKVSLSVDDPHFFIRFVGNPPELILPDETLKGALFVEVSDEKINKRKTWIHLTLRSDTKVLDKTKTTFLGPEKIK